MADVRQNGMTYMERIQEFIQNKYPDELSMIAKKPDCYVVSMKYKEYSIVFKVFRDYLNTNNKISPEIELYDPYKQKLYVRFKYDRERIKYDEYIGIVELWGFPFEDYFNSMVALVDELKGESINSNYNRFFRVIKVEKRFNKSILSEGRVSLLELDHRKFQLGLLALNKPGVYNVNILSIPTINPIDNPDPIKVKKHIYEQLDVWDSKVKNKLIQVAESRGEKNTYEAVIRKGSQPESKNKYTILYATPDINNNTKTEIVKLPIEEYDGKLNLSVNLKFDNKKSRHYQGKDLAELLRNMDNASQQNDPIWHFFEVIDIK